MPRKCKFELRTLKQVPMNLLIRSVLFYLLVAEGIESNPWPQTRSTRGNSSPRGSPRGHGYNGCASGHGSRQDPIDSASADPSLHDPAGLSNQVDLPHTLRRASRSQNQLSVSSQPSVSS